MKRGLFYTTLIPYAMGVLLCSTSWCEKQDSSTAVSQQSAQMDCATIDVIAAHVAEEYAQKYSIPPHVASYVSDNMCNALILEQKWKIPAAASLAKAGSEHSYGTRGDKIAKGNNHFGIKFCEQFKDIYPNSFKALTWEMVNGKRKEVMADFTYYDTALDSYLHFGQFLTERKIGGRNPYENVLRNVGDSHDFLIALAHSPFSSNLQELEMTLTDLDRYHLEDIVAEVKEKTKEKESKEKQKDSAEKTENPFARTAVNSGLYAVCFYSEGFRQGDFILMEIEPREEYTSGKVAFTYNTGKRRETAKIPLFEYNGKIYGQMAIDFEYPSQTATVALEATIGRRTFTDTYRLEIGEREFLDELITDMEKTTRTRPTQQQKKAKERFYKSWLAITSEAYIAEGYFAPVDGECNREMFGSRRIWQDNTQSRHRGVDCPGNIGDSVYTILNGRVAYTDAVALPEEGIATAVDHGYGLSTLYLHQNEQSVSAGTNVVAGENIGYIGTTGHSSGAHLDIRAKFTVMLDTGKKAVMNIDPLSLAIANDVFK